MQVGTKLRRLQPGTLLIFAIGMVFAALAFPMAHAVGQEPATDPNAESDDSQAPPAPIPEDEAPPVDGRGAPRRPGTLPAPTPASTPTPAAVAAPEIPISPNGQRPLAIVSLDTKLVGSAAEVTGAMHVYNGRAFITSNGTVTAGDHTAQITLPYRGTLSICASTSVHLSTDASVAPSEVPGLLMAIDHGAIEASFATGRDSDILMTPDFRILISGPGPADVKVRLGQHGDTCVDNAGDAPYVLVSSVFDGGAYRVQARQRVMFQHGSLHEVVDQEKEPCGCPPAAKGANDFPLAQSEGLAPLFHPDKSTEKVGHNPEPTVTLSYNAGNTAKAPESQPAPPPPTVTAPAPIAPAAQPPAVNPPVTTPPAVATPAEPPPPQLPPAAPPAKKKTGFFKHIGNFFRKVFGSE